MRRRTFLVPASAIAMLLVMTSTAWACTKFLGSLSITGSSTSGITVTSHGTDDPTPTVGANATQILTHTPAGPNQTAACGGLSTCGLPGTFTISTGASGPIPATNGWPGNPLNLFAPHAAIPGGSTLPAGRYNVTFQPGPVYVSHVDNTPGDGSDMQFGVVTNAGIPQCYSFGVTQYVDPTATTGGNGGGVLLGTVNIGAAGTITGVVLDLTDPLGLRGGTPNGTATATPKFVLPNSPSNATTDTNLNTGPLPPFNWGVNTTAPGYAEESAVCVSSSAGATNMVPLTVL